MPPHGRSRRPNPHLPQTLLGLIDSLYASALDPKLWPSFLADLNGATGSLVGAFVLQDVAGQSGMNLWQAGAGAPFESAYADWASRNIYLIEAGARFETGVVMRGEDVVPDRVAVKTEFFNEFLRPVGVLHNTGIAVFRERSLVVALMLLRRIGHPSHSEQDLALVRLLVPHLQRAIAIHRNLAGVELERAVAVEALDRMPLGVFVLGRAGDVLYFNRSAGALVQANDGLSVRAGGVLEAARSSESSRLRQLIAGACATSAVAAMHAGGALTITRPSRRRPFSVLVTPVRSSTFALAPTPPAAIVFVADPERAVRGVDEMLCQLYGLTPSQAKVATLLIEGKRVDEIREILEISENTARSHVRRILEKTAARGQGDLIRMLIGGPAGLVLDQPGGTLVRRDR